MKRFSSLLVLGSAVVLVSATAGAQTLADKYDREVRIHKSMANTWVGNPNHPLTATMAVHCRQLADAAAAKAGRARNGELVEEPSGPPPPRVGNTGRSPSPSH